ncbi:MAG: methyltransferase domain-containing protein [Patescibacteria group bacterium]
MNNPIKINFGCGYDIKPGWVNVDSSQLPGVDIVHDVQQVPLPFASGSISEVVCQDIFEHIEYIPVLKDIFRILQPGGTITIRVPHFTSKNSYTDPTHKKIFAIRTFDFFTTHPPKGRGYYHNFSFTKMVKKIITFERSSRWFLYNAIVSRIVNYSARNQYIYESTGWSRIFPAENIEITLRK